MSFIETPAEDTARGAAAELLAADRAGRGFVANYTRVFATRPAVYLAWDELSDRVKETMDPRRYELVTLAAARRLRSSYCALAHGNVLAKRFYGMDAVRAIAVDPAAAGIEPADVAAMELAEKVVDDATSVTQADIDRLRGLGLSDADIFDVVATAAMRCFFSKTLDALGVLPDAAYEELEPGLREVLAVGRPIAGS